MKFVQSSLDSFTLIAQEGQDIAPIIEWLKDQGPLIEPSAGKTFISYRAEGWSADVIHYTTGGDDLMIRFYDSGIAALFKLRWMHGPAV